MSSFTIIPDNFNPEDNFWDVNPQHKIIPPFSILYKEYGKKKSSKIMWACVMMSHPDPEKNKLYRLPYEDRKRAIEENYLESIIDWDDELLVECLNKYETVCLSAVERALKAEKDFLEKRAKFLTEAPYNLETMQIIDASVARTAKIYENFERIEEKFNQSRALSSTVYGGRQESYAEKKLL